MRCVPYRPPSPRLPLVWGEGLIAYLDAYPYPCTEQLVSKGFASLLLPCARNSAPSRPATRSPLQAPLHAAKPQNDSGGFGLWSSSPQTADFPTVYAAHFLIESHDHGQKVRRCVPVLMGPAQALTPDTQPGIMRGRLRAYAVYLLARQGIKPAAVANVEQELAAATKTLGPTDLCRGLPGFRPID